MWVASTFPRKPSFEIDRAIAAGQVQQVDADQLARRRAAEALSYSLAGRLGRAMEPLLRPLGFDWRINTALVGAFAAKEVFVAQMGIIYSLGDAEGSVGQLSRSLQRDYSPLVGLSLALFLLIATPCMATVAATRRESGSWRWALLQFGGLTAVAYLVALVAYQGGMLLTGHTIDPDVITLGVTLCLCCWFFAPRLLRLMLSSAGQRTYKTGCTSCSSCASSVACGEKQPGPRHSAPR